MSADRLVWVLPFVGGGRLHVLLAIAPLFGWLTKSLADQLLFACFLVDLAFFVLVLVGAVGFGQVVLPGLCAVLERVGVLCSQVAAFAI